MRQLLFQGDSILFRRCLSKYLKIFRGYVIKSQNGLPSYGKMQL